MGTTVPMRSWCVPFSSWERIMNTENTLNDLYLADRAFEQEDRLINEAKNMLYARLQTRDLSLSSTSTVRDYLGLQLAGKQSEVFSCLFLDSQHRLIEYREMFVGTIDSCNVYPREVVKAALQVNAAALIFAHNHPSGVAEPSHSDEVITRRLKEALLLVDIRVLDHFIVSNDVALSLAERGLI